MLVTVVVSHSKDLLPSLDCVYPEYNICLSAAVPNTTFSLPTEAIVGYHEPIDWLPSCPQDALSFKLLIGLTLKKLSSEILHAPDNDGNTPQRLSFLKREEPSTRKLKENK